MNKSIIIKYLSSAAHKFSDVGEKAQPAAAAPMPEPDSVPRCSLN